MTTIKLKNGSGAPTAGDLVQGEPALDLTNKRLYTEDSGGTVIEVGTNPTSITTGDITATGTATFANLATSGDVTFGDNDKAIFGAGSDLQIYHTGSVSVIEDSGTGNLLIRGTDMRLQNAAGDNNYLKAVDGAEVELMHGGATKLATTSTGIDVTGSVTASDGVFTDGAAGSASVFNEDGTTADFRVESTSNTHMLFVDGGLNSVGIGTASPEHALHVNGGTSNTVAQFQSTDANAYIEFLDSDAGASGVFIGGDGDDFVVLPNATEKFRVTSSGNVGIGTTSPSTSLDIDAGSTSEYFRGAGNSGSARYLVLSASTTTNAGDTHTFNASSSTGHLQFATAGVDRVTIDSSGRVGIGTSSPSYVVHASTADNTIAQFQSTDNRGAILVSDNDTDSYFGSEGGSTYISNAGGALSSGQLVIDSSGNVGIGSAPVAGRGRFQIHDGNTDRDMDAYGQGQLHIDGNGYAFGIALNTQGANIYTNSTSRGIIFGTNETERVRIDGSGNVKIGTDVDQTSFLTETTANLQIGGGLIFEAGAGNNAEILNYRTTAMVFGNGGSENMRIDSSGNVLFGATGTATNNYGAKVLKDGSSSEIFAVHRQASDGNLITFARGGTDAGGITYTGGYLNINGQVSGVTASVAGSEQLRVTASSIDVQGDAINQQAASNWYIRNRVSGGVINLGVETSAGSLYYPIQMIGSSNIIKFENASGEIARFDSSGNAVFGKSSANNTAAGTTIYNEQGISVVRDANTTAIFNRLTSDGEIVAFRKDGTTVGSIFSYNGFLGIGSPSGNDAYLLLGSDFVAPATSTGTARDGAIDLGASGRRFKDVYATNGTIQTSDRNEKQDIEELSDAEQRVAVACKGLLRKYRWKSAVEEKGDDARIHFGIIAQDLQDAFTAEGLDAGRYGMFINTTWTDEETGEERSRMGVRYSELLAFIISAI